jgi:hypothetical protein
MSRAPASAQTIWSPIEHQPSVRVEALLLRPD